MIYKKMFELSILHSFYDHKLCSDLVLIPTTKTQKKLSGHQLIIKRKVNGIVVFFVQLNNINQTCFDFFSDLELDFFLTLQNYSFFNYTEEDFQLNISPSSLFKIATDSFYFTKKKEFVAVTKTSPFSAKGKKSWGIITIKTSYSILNQQLEIPNYQIYCFSKSYRWRYYVVTLFKDIQLSIYNENIEFSEFEEVSQNDPLHSIFNRQSFGVFAKKYFFQSTSNKKIIYKNLGIKNIKLNFQWGTSLNYSFENLPSPSIGNIIKLSKTQELIQYQVINLVQEF